MQRFFTDCLKCGNCFCLCDLGLLLDWFQGKFHLILTHMQIIVFLHILLHYIPLAFHWLDFCNSRLAVLDFTVVSKAFDQHIINMTVSAAFLNGLYFAKNQWFPSLNVILPLGPQNGLETTTFFLRLPYSEKTKQTSIAKHWHEWNPKPSGWRWKILEGESRTGELCFNPITSRSSWLC